MSNPDDLRLYHRAIAALLKYGAQQRQPSEALSGVEEHDGLRYVVLRNTEGLIAAYRLRGDDKLKRLKRLPAGVSEKHIAA